MKKPLYSIIVLTLVFFAIFTGLYYFLALRPALTGKASKTDIQRELEIVRSGLIENRLNIMSLVTLDPAQSSYIGYLPELIQQLPQSNNVASQYLEKDEVLKQQRSNKTTTALQTDIISAHMEALSLYNKERGVIQDVLSYYALVEKVLLYDISSDIFSLDLIADREELLERSTSAQAGLNTVKESLDPVSMEDPLEQSRVTAVVRELDRTVALFNMLDQSIQNGNRSKYISDRIELENRFIQLKVAAHQFIITPFQTSQSLQLLTDHSNLILKYDQLIQDTANIE